MFFLFFKRIYGKYVWTIMLYRIVMTFSIVVPKFMANTFIKIMPYRVKILERQKIRKNGTNKPCSAFNADLIFAIKN